MPGSRLEAFEKFVEKDPANVLARYSLAMELRKAGRFEDAMASFAEVLAVDPSYVPAYFMAGQTAVECGKGEEARRILNAGIEAAKKAGETHAADKMGELLRTIE